ncbi:MAG TPA: hypothetical protein VLJ57_09020 [Burkholderiaceae bacterium]|nr:hypothetical protein [Burkholderiaceae bacterium]
MPNLSIKDVPEAWAEALRRRAANNHRSLQGELMAIVGCAVAEAEATSTTAGAGNAPSKPVRIVGYDRSGYPIVRQGWKTVEQVAAELQAKYPKPILDQMPSVDLIRQDRDSR